MATATRRRRTLKLREDVRGHKPQRVDREQGVVYGVRVLGPESPSWKRRYTAAALEKALPLYEGVKVKVNHPPRGKAGEDRSVLETFGWLSKPRLGDDGAIYADLHVLNPKTELAESVFNAAERNPRIFGLSHNADGHDAGRDADGWAVIDEITELRSVDLVDNPSTNTSLFEGRKVATTLRKVLESAKHLSAKRRKKLLEMGAACEDEITGAPMLDNEMDEPEPEEEDGRALLARAVACLVQGEDEADHELATKVMRLLKPESAEEEEKPEEEGEEGKAKEEEKPEEEEEEEEEPKKEEGKKPRKPAGLLLTESRAKALCDLAGVADKALLESITGIPEDKAVGILKRLRPGARTGPRSQAPGGAPLTESRAPRTAEEQASLLLR